MPLDIGLGLIGGALFHRLTGAPLSISLILAVGFVLLPDLDGVIQSLRRGQPRGMGYTHRDLLHVPLVYVPVGTALAYACSGGAVAALFLVMSLLHFVHDSIGTGWGIAWLRPFSRDYFKFLSEDKGDASFTAKKLLVRWTPEQQRAVAREYGNPNWLRDMYLKPQRPYLRILILEILFLLAGFVAILVIR